MLPDTFCHGQNTVWAAPPFLQLGFLWFPHPLQQSQLDRGLPAGVSQPWSPSQGRPQSGQRSWQMLPCECFKNKQHELDLYLISGRLRTVSFTKRSPFLQWHFKDDSTSSSLFMVTNVEGMPGGSPVDPGAQEEELLCLLRFAGTWRTESFAQVQLHQIPVLCVGKGRRRDRISSHVRGLNLDKIQ